MPQVIVTEAQRKAWNGAGGSWVSRQAARRAGQAIERQFLQLETTPDIGRPLPEMPELRELLIAFGDSGYVALYHHEPGDDAVYVLAFRHQKEASY
ncbi:type II toxin-antitoxin system RelE/ParE family toxin [Pistricoccus aurantiacus]|uniref:type II toxin-antitoxin system RelE/ParE family toxin n=1 Tax=Pistricoccus aurantiacus TaxID=1883414 RepID=UPI00363B87E1